MGSNNNGIVAGTVGSNSGCSGSCKRGNPHGWNTRANLIQESYGYNYLYKVKREPLKRSGRLRRALYNWMFVPRIGDFTIYFSHLKPDIYLYPSELRVHAHRDCGNRADNKINVLSKND